MGAEWAASVSVDGATAIASAKLGLSLRPLGLCGEFLAWLGCSNEASPHNWSVRS
jgi:hypothetical protein